MDAPKPEADGFRYYDSWAGNPGGRREDVTCCIEAVRKRNIRFPHYCQCTRKRGHGLGGLYCKQHDPEAVKAREAKARADWAAKWKARMRPSHEHSAMHEALTAILDGHNDPCALAREVLEQVEKGVL